jgi:prepilin signal peptidase PulO-like enzyme (type II secretory pathway)
MAIELNTILYSLLAAAVSWFALPALVVGIPRRIEQQWRSEFEAQGGYFDEPLQASTVEMKILDKVALSSVTFASFFLLLQVKGTGLDAGWLYAYFAVLILLLFINLRATLLPDNIVLPTIWLGLFVHAMQGTCTEQIYGAIAGYLVPFLVYWMFKIGTGREALGHGDMKTMAMAGAWLGQTAIPTLVIVFALGCVVTLIAIKVFDLRHDGYVPTGPAHFVASLLVATGLNLT